MAVDRIERPQTSGRAHEDLVERLQSLGAKIEQA